MDDVFSVLFGIQANNFERQISAGLCLYEPERSSCDLSQAFEDKHSESIKRLRSALELLPPLWARELSFQVLKEEKSEAARSTEQQTHKIFRLPVSADAERCLQRECFISTFFSDFIGQDTAAIYHAPESSYDFSRQWMHFITENQLEFSFCLNLSRNEISSSLLDILRSAECISNVDGPGFKITDCFSHAQPLFESRYLLYQGKDQERFLGEVFYAETGAVSEELINWNSNLSHEFIPGRHSVRLKMMLALPRAKFQGPVNICKNLPMVLSLQKGSPAKIYPALLSARKGNFVISIISREEILKMEYGELEKIPVELCMAVLEMKAGDLLKLRPGMKIESKISGPLKAVLRVGGADWASVELEIQNDKIVLHSQPLEH